jgi:uncharacterized membrane protein
MLNQFLLFLHIACVIIWVGGMFFAYFCLRPAAVQVLEPPQRLPLWVATFKSFFFITAVAVVILLISGFAMFLQVGFKNAPLGWHLMMTLGLLMAGIFGHVYAVLYPRLSRQSAASEWPAAAATLNSIRKMVGLNLLLALCTVASVVLVH